MQIGVRHWLVCQKLYIDENVPHHQSMKDRVGVVAERQTPKQEILGSIPTAVIVLCP